MQCARCHDHKFDPIAQREFYQFFGFFQNIAYKQASYNNFVGADPIIRVPSADQKALLEQLQGRELTVDLSMKLRETLAMTEVATWGKGLTPEARRSHVVTG